MKGLSGEVRVEWSLPLPSPLTYRSGDTVPSLFCTVSGGSGYTSKNTFESHEDRYHELVSIVDRRLD